jgi:transposase
MTKSHDTPRTVTLVAIDVAKGHHDVLVEPPAPTRRRRFRLDDSVEDYERFAGYLRSIGASALIGFEATGNYHRPLVYFLQRSGFELQLIPTIALARLARPCTTPGTRTIPKTRK